MHKHRQSQQLVLQTMTQQGKKEYLSNGII
jgi:hypothetical protein